MDIVQRIFGFFNNQTVNNTNIIISDQYLNDLLKFQNNPSDVNQIVLSLYNLLTEEIGTVEKRVLPPEIEEKITFNNVIKYKLLIENNFSENGYYLDSAYESLDYDTPGRKKLFLSYINSLYLSVLGEYLKASTSSEKLEVIRGNSDNIITVVINKLLTKISNNSTGIEHISSESIEYNVIAIVCHAFVDCKVLENPNNK
jgi:hypothetical protein